MPYILNSVTIRTNNSDIGMKKIEELWNDVVTGKIPILFDSEHRFLKGISPM